MSLLETQEKYAYGSEEHIKLAQSILLKMMEHPDYSLGKGVDNRDSLTASAFAIAESFIDQVQSL